MTEPSGTDPVRAHFRRDAEYWSSIYDDAEDRASGAYRERLDRVLAYVEALQVAPPARVVDVGAGAGLASVALATLGYDVLAVDSTKRMLELTEARAAAAGTTVRVAEADATSLPLDDGSVDLVVAVGLVPWLSDPIRVLAEFRRVLRPAGGLVVTADNRWRVTELADPAETPFLAPVRRFVVRPLRRRRGWTDPAFHPRRHTRGTLERLLTRSGFTIVESSTVGYSPISIMRRPLQGRPAVAIERQLARRAAAPLMRSLGVHIVTAATAPRP